MSNNRSSHPKKVSESKPETANADIQEIAEESKDDAMQIIETAKRLDPKFLNGISHSKQEALVRGLAMSLSIQKTHSGPLPDPDTLAGYKNIIDNGAERIMAMAEKEQNARLNERSTVSNRMLNQSGTGQLFGFIICMTAIVGGIFLSANGKETSGISAIITALVSLVAAFLYSKHKERQ
jgi:uncharacterized membrane protein